MSVKRRKRSQELNPSRGFSIVRQSVLTKALLLSFLVIGFYLPALHAGYIWDDRNVIENPNIVSPKGLFGLWRDPKSISAVESGYWPLTYTSFWIEYRIWGDRPFGYHLTNVVLHLANAMLVWLVLMRLGVPWAWFAALVYALHPMRVESVAWVVERKDLLSGFFYLFSLKAYLSLSQTMRSRHYWFSLAWFICALLSKSVAVTLPAAILAILWWRNGRIERREVLRLIPFFAAGLVLSLLGMVLTRQSGQLMEELGVVERFLVAGRAFWFYAVKTVLPFGLMAVFPKWSVDSTIWWQYLFPIFAALTFAVLWSLRERLGRGAFVSVFYFALTLSPTLGFFNFPLFRYTYVTQRYAYLGSIGL
ncbi:MAG TPA: O-GlcNAc transferase, partial [bacterium]|nr:O-GlcNAc transferase [bacterium]